MADAVSDDDRERLEAAIAAALLLLYLGAKREAGTLLGLTGSPEASAEAQARIAAFAAERAALVQAGINQRAADAESELPDDADPAAVASAQAQVRSEAGHYNDTVLIPFLVSWSWHQGLVDTYAETTDPETGQTMLESVQWEWQQNTDFVDDCTAAESASPASFEELVGIAGGAPPAHGRCDCDLFAAT